MFAKVEYITPNTAKAYLQRNTNNYRTPTRTLIDKYAKDMASGLWKLNGEPIIFAQNGMLLDGQHRLLACVKANCPFSTLVVRGADNDTTIIDVGGSRTATQIIGRMTDSRYARDNQVVGAAKIIVSNSWKPSRVPTAVLATFMCKTENEWETAYTSVVCGCNHPISLRSMCVLAGYCLLATGASKDEMHDFFCIVNTGFPVDGRECSPAIVLRNYLLACKSCKDTEETRKAIFSATISAYLGFCNGEKRTRAYRYNESHEDLLKAVRKMKGANNE